MLHHARYVFTNSFHGTAFSINYRKDFYVEFSSLTNSRLEPVDGQDRVNELARMLGGVSPETLALAEKMMSAG